MKRFALILLLAATLGSCGSSAEWYPKVKDVRAKELNAGPSSSLVRKVKKYRKAPSGLEYISENFRIKHDTDSIEAKLGNSFGLEYLIWAEKKSYVPIQVVWTFPKEIVNDKGKKFRRVKYKTKELTHYRLNMSFGMHKEYLVVKGDWKLEIFHKKKKILEKIFHLI